MKQILMTTALCLTAWASAAETTRPMPRPAEAPVVDPIPAAQWDHHPQSDQWARAALKALKGHGEDLVETVPDDIARWCPGYATGTDQSRRAFWVGLLSAMAKHESTWRPRAVGGGGLYYGLMQIYPRTARAYGCRATDGEALMNGGNNLSCALRIMANTVPRDGVIAAGGGGVAADWGPMARESKRSEMRRWLSGQDYCQITVSKRPMPRPFDIASVAAR